MMEEKVVVYRLSFEEGVGGEELLTRSLEAVWEKFATK